MCSQPLGSTPNRLNACPLQGGSTQLTITQLTITHNKHHVIAQSTYLGDKFGESLGGSQATPSFCGSPQTSPEVPQTSPEVFGDFPGSSLTVELYSNPGVPRKFPGLPRKFPGLPRRSALSLESLTPSPDSQKTFPEYQSARLKKKIDPK